MSGGALPQEQPGGGSPGPAPPAAGPAPARESAIPEADRPRDPPPALLPQPPPGAGSWRLANALSACAIVALIWLIVTRTPALRAWYDYTWTVSWGAPAAAPAAAGDAGWLAQAFTHGQVWWTVHYLLVVDAIALAWGAGYALFFLCARDIGPRGPMHFWSGLGKLPASPLAPGLTPEERHALLSVAVKACFMPLMAKFTADNIHGLSLAMGNTLHYWSSDIGLARWYVLHGHWAAFNLMLAVDTAIFFLAYGIDHERLGNKVRSVEPTLLGWVVALCCYPLWNDLSGRLLGWAGGDLPDAVRHFGDMPAAWTATVVLGVLSNLCFLIYVAATVALGMKAGNLVNRGIVDRGPYAWVRHPAYVSKNLAWGLAAAVMIAALASRGDWAAAGGALCSWAAWAFIYHLRALTEERHLSRDPDYVAYMARVRYRYIPGVY